MENDIWNARRIKLEKAVKSAVLDLFEHMGAAGSFYLPIDERLSIMAGPHELLDMRKPVRSSPPATILEFEDAIGANVDISA